MSDKKIILGREELRGEEVTVIGGLGEIDLTDTLECGQAFRYEETARDDGYVEYLTVVGRSLLRIGQRRRGELIFFGDEETAKTVVLPYFNADTDFDAVRVDILSRTNSAVMAEAASASRGIVILKQEPWETLFSFIISQNNNIPRIRKIIRMICGEYGENLAVRGELKKCPTGRINGTPCHENCKECGICYTFPTAEEVLARPEGLLPSHPGFRYRYLLDAAERVHSGDISLEGIAKEHSYAYTLSELKRIVGVGDKVASCVALFGFGNLEAFPIDVWIRRAIDTYFDGRLSAEELGPYAGVAQQYIFHYIRNTETKENK